MENSYRALNVRTFLTHQGRSLTWLAGVLGLSYRYTVRLVNGRVDASPYMATRISDLLGAPLETLFLTVYVAQGKENSPSDQDERVTA